MLWLGLTARIGAGSEGILHLVVLCSMWALARSLVLHWARSERMTADGKHRPNG